jgi:hypothetical protein
MSYWAELDENNVVLRVTIGDNNDPNGDEGYQWLIDNLGGTWIKTSYNATFRKNYAGIGYTYDSVRDAFISPKPFESWSLNEDTCLWEAPIERPTFDPEDPKYYDWDEPTLSWVEIELTP